VPDYTKAQSLGQGIESINAHEEWILSVFTGRVKKINEITFEEFDKSIPKSI
jgi:hypothetical protein